MTRTGDVAIPTVTPHPAPAGSPLARWVPWRPVFALEQLPQAAYVWDDTDPAVVWDAPGPARRLVFPGVVGNYGAVAGLSVVTAATSREIVFRIAVDNWDATTGFEGIAWRANSFMIRRTTVARQLSFIVYGTPANPTLNATYPAGTFTANQLVWFRCTYAPSGAYTWSYSTAAADTEPTTWTSFGSGTSTAATVVHNTQAINVGREDPTRAFRGRIARLIIRDGIAGPTVLDIADANASGVAVGATTFTAGTGQAVVLTQTAGNQIVQQDPTDFAYVWDAPFIGGGFTDAACDWMAFDVDPGEPDELYVFPAVEATLTLDNADGAYTPWSSDGRLVYWAPGRRMCVYWLHTSTAEKRWLFSGRVASWTVNVDDTVTVTAFDGFPALAQQIGPWTPGAAGDTPRARILAVASTAQYTDPIVADIGDVTLSTGETTDAPLDVIEQAALSDGGLFYGDADGSLRYANRLWRAGRTDAPKTWTVSDNVCTVPVVVWNPEAAADDERLATVVRLANAAGLIATATAADTVWTGGARWVLTHPDPDLWQTQQQGDVLAAHLLAQQSTPSMALSRFDVYGLDPHQPSVADFATDVRRGDRLEVLHEYVDPDGMTGMLDLFAIVLGVGHNLTPDEWVSHYQLSRTVDYRTVEMWDRTVYVWDETAGTAAANNVWRY